MSVRHSGDVTIIDNSNSGTNAATTIEAAGYARALSQQKDLTLVIGQEPGDGAVCEGFSDNQIHEVIRSVRPAQVIIVGNSLAGEQGKGSLRAGKITRAPTLAGARESALALTRRGSIVLAVKTWR
jgi:hypothetical protein